MKGLLNRLSYLLGRRRFDEDLDAEFQFHIEVRADELEAAGMTRAAAVAQARREFGPRALASEDTRSAWQFRRIEELAADLRYAARGFRRNPAFALTAIACLALAIGANTTIFSVAMEALFSQPSVRDANAMIAIRAGGSSHAKQETWRFLRDARLFDGIAGENEEIETNWRHGDRTERLFAVRMTDNFFDVTGIPVAIGRPPARGESDAVVLSDGLWRRGFNSDPSVVGRSMLLDGRAFNIVGVLPRDHRTVTGFGFSPELYVPVVREDTRVALYARMPQDMTRDIARQRLAVTLAQLDKELASNIEVTAVCGIERLGSNNIAPVAAFFGMLIVVVGLVLLIACANVASMLLARAAARSHEIAVRLSIGAGRGRLLRQLLAESLLLAACGTAAGLALNLALTTLLSNIRLPLPIPIQFQIRPDWRLLAYSIAVAVGTCVAAGLVPALQATRAGVGAALQPGTRQAGGRSRLRSALVIAQVTASVVLLSAGTLFLRNLLRASTTNPGFDLQHTAWGLMRLVPESYVAPEKSRAVVNAALDRLRSLPGVDSATVAKVVPLNGNETMGATLRPDGGAAVPVEFRFNHVGADYFRVMQIPLLAGREFTASERGVAIVNEAFARRVFGRGDAVGHTLVWGKETITVIGVAKNSKYFTLGEHDKPAYYAPYFTMGEPAMTLNFLVRASGRPESVLAAVAKALGGLDTTAAVEVKPMSQAMVFALLPSRAGAAILGSVGLLGLALAAIGLYGALLYSVTRRAREIGVRVALGATPSRILRLVTGQGAMLSGAGIAIGLAISVVAVRPLALFLTPEVKPGDASTFVIVAGALMAVAVVSIAGPAIRALRLDPATALRHE
jgi:predicted permease